MLNDDPAAVGHLLRDPRTVLGLTDSGAHADRIVDSNFPTYLGHWVRKQGALPLEFAVWRLTKQVANALGITDRGLIDVGYAADLVAFDADRIAAGPPPSASTTSLLAGND